MTMDLFIALLGFAFVTSVTPGPNNLMLMASGANFGWHRTLPHMLGVTLGHALMVFLVGLGLAGLFRAVPGSLTMLKVLSVAYMLWLAWKIAHAGAPGEGHAADNGLAGAGPAGDVPGRPVQARAAATAATPMTFLQAAAFQWVNPKAWAMALGAVAAYVPQPSPSAYLLVALVFAAVNLPSVSLWAAAGQAVRRWLDGAGRLRAFNWTMAALLVASLWPVVTMEL